MKSYFKKENPELSRDFVEYSLFPHSPYIIIPFVLSLFQCDKLDVCRDVKLDEYWNSRNLHLMREVAKPQVLTEGEIFASLDYPSVLPSASQLP